MTFLRPWFLLLILLPFVFRLFMKQTDTASNWAKLIDKQLLPYLLVKKSSAKVKHQNFYKIALWLLLSVAAAGPAYFEEQVPTHTEQPGTVIVLDLSQAMTGDLLIQARRKIQDILSILKNEQVALVIYDKYGYTAVPLTFETDIIRDMIPYLEESVLPESVSDPIAGFKQAEQLFKNAGMADGRILFLTTGAFLPDNLDKTLQQIPHKIGILGIGPIEPHPIALPDGGFLTGKDGKPIMIHPRQEMFPDSSIYQPITPDDSDIKTLMQKTNPNTNGTGRETGGKVSIQKDMGGWIVVVLLPFFAFLFRKGITVILIIGFSLSAQAGWWHRADQEAYSQQIAAVQSYRAGDFEKSANIFKHGQREDDLYNLGNALAFQQKLTDAIEAYQRVLEQNPTHQDARYNKEYLENILKQQAQNNQFQEQLDHLKNLVRQESELKKQELSEIEQQQDALSQKQESGDSEKSRETGQNQKNKSERLKNLADQIKEEWTRQQQEMDQINQIDPQNQKETENKLKDMMTQVKKELQQREESNKQVNDENNPDMSTLKDMMKQEYQLKQKRLETISKMLDPQENTTSSDNLPDNHILPLEQNSEKPETHNNTPFPETINNTIEVEEDIPVFDQDEQKILNRLKNNQAGVLRYRIRQQYLKRIGGE